MESGSSDKNHYPPGSQLIMIKRMCLLSGVSLWWLSILSPFLKKAFVVASHIKFFEDIVTF